MPRFFDVQIVIEGVNFAGVIDALKEQKIKSISRLDATHLQIVCSVKRHKKVVAILKEKCYTIQALNFGITFSFLKNGIKRTGLLIGIFLAIIINALLSFFIWDFSLCGDQSLKAEIEQVLCKNGIKKGCLKFGLKSEKIEQILQENVSSLSLADVSFRGCTVVINYTKKQEKTHQILQQENLLAKFDGVISSISVLSGTAMVSPGDFVKKGDILIAGFEGEDENKTLTQAQGQVFAYRWISATVEFPKEKIEWARTGNFVTNTSVYLFDEEISKTEESHNFEKFEEEKEEFYLAKSSPLPLKFVSTKIFELSAVTVSQEFEPQKDKLSAQAKLIAWENLSGAETVLDEKTEINFVSNIWFVSHYIKIKEKIS